MSRPTVERGPIRHTENGRTTVIWYVKCPKCGTVGQIDVDQYHGKVSMVCPGCDYHETHDLAVTK